MSGRREKRTNKKDETVGDVEAEVEVEDEIEAEAEVDEESPSSTNNDGKKTRKVKESVIDHTYRDYSLVEVEDEEEVPNAGEEEHRPTVARAAAGVDLSKNSNFPAKLHAILSNPGYQHIICWMPHGRSWNIIDKHLLATLVLPKFFAHGKFESFNRSVNGWGFKRLLREGPDKRTYYYECFLRGRPELTGLMQRLSNPGKRLPDKAGEPNFYEISRKYPLPELTPMEPYHGGLQSSPMSSGHPPPPGMLHHPFAYPPHASAQYGMMYGGGYHHGMSPPGGMPPPSPASSSAGGKGVQSQQQYWSGQYAPNYPPNPYGYYPYPHMMMGPPPPQAMGAGGPGNPYQGYYYPYQHPSFPPSPLAASSPNGAAAFGVAAEENYSVKVKEEKEAAVNTDEMNGEKSDNDNKVEEAAKDDDAPPDEDDEEKETVEI